MPGDGTRLPVPDWTRPGETWRIEPESAVRWRTDVDGIRCEKRGHERRPAVAGMTRRNGEFRAFCEPCMTQSLMWVEDGIVVSWSLRP